MSDRTADGRFGTHSTANATLTRADVQGIRDLRRAGFSVAGIALAYRVATRTVRKIIAGQSWRFVPDVPAPLPIFANRPEAARELRVRVRRLTAEQRAEVDAYRRRLAAHLEAEAEREALAVALLREWSAAGPGSRRRTIQRPALAAPPTGGVQ
jgi:hypothetical protein